MNPISITVTGRLGDDPRPFTTRSGTALVEAVLLDVDDTTYLAVTLEDDPAADLQAAHGRFLYFSPDEIEPCMQEDPCPGEDLSTGEDEGGARP